MTPNMEPLEATRYFIDEQDWVTSGNDTQYLIEEHDSHVIIVFQQSNGKTDWLNNFRFWKKPYKNMDTKFYVHSGFCKCWKLIRDEIAKKVTELNPTSITVIGWSHGAALAVLAHEDMWYRFVKCREDSEDVDVILSSLRGKIKCITFGCPRVIGIWNFKKIKERFEGVTLFNNGSDIVCTVPPNWMFYRHVVQQTHIGKLRHFWDYFKPSKWHNIEGDYGYYQTLSDIRKGKD